MKRAVPIRFVAGTLFAALCLVGLLLALFRLLTYLFFFPVNPFWFAVPALTIAGLALLPWRPPALQPWLIGGLLTAWLCSYYFFNWETVAQRYASGNWTLVIDAVEAMVMVGLVLVRVIAARNRA